jgi:hypothetical protein
MSRLFPVVLVAAVSMLASADADTLPVPKHGQCPASYRESGGYCVPMAGSPAAIPKQGHLPEWLGLGGALARGDPGPAAPQGELGYFEAARWFSLCLDRSTQTGWGQWCANTTVPSTQYAYLRSADAEWTSLYSDDQHFSAAGQALLAAYDFGLLTQLLFLPQLSAPDYPA